MGCICSKGASKPLPAPISSSPSLNFSVAAPYAAVDNVSTVSGSKRSDCGRKKDGERADHLHRHELKRSKKGSSHGRSGQFIFKLGFSNRHVEAEQAAAGWPAWLTAVAAEAVHGWVPLRADAFEKLDKIGQGTYSSVFRAREVATGKVVALKKVRFDNFQAESIRFMAREITILRRLDHPNIMKLEGVVTSQLSTSIYLVFEYMEHDLAGLSSCPDIKLTESQIKCYMKQLLCGLEHCHLRGIMHRDIKASNILVNNDGILKLGDFGLANVLSKKNRQQLTSRVVTLWYRPPELLMGSTNYGVSVDLWSVGCVFAELLIGKPILKGRTEVEQLHKIFKLCGSPSEEYWRNCKLTHATMFKPQHTYESSLQERCREFPKTAVSLIETFLTVEPENRGTASSALNSEYFRTKPYPCDPSCLPKFPPNKEIDAKRREEARRKKVGARMRDSGASRKTRRVRKPLQEPNTRKLQSKEEEEHDTEFASRKDASNAHMPRGRGGSMDREPYNSLDSMPEVSHLRNESGGFTGPEPVLSSSGFAWAKRQNEYAASSLFYDPCGSVSQISALDFPRSGFDSKNGKNEDILNVAQTNLSRHDLNETPKHAIQEQQNRFDWTDCLNASDVYHHSHDFSMPFQNEQGMVLRRNLGHDNQAGMFEFSGPILSESHRVDAFLQRNESQIRRATRKPRFERDR